MRTLTCIAGLAAIAVCSASPINGTSPSSTLQPVVSSTYEWLLTDYLTYTSDPELRDFIEFDMWKNELILPTSWYQTMPHIAAVWMRNFVAGSILYYTVGGLWAAVIYGCQRHKYFPDGDVPTAKAIMEQVAVSQAAMVLYTFMPTLSEWMVERGYTLAYDNFADVGIVRYLLYMAVYLLLVEFGIYWVHRLEHDFPFLYKWLHADHHIYNKENTLSPFGM